MRNAASYNNEAQRLASLKSLRMLDTPIEERFERITRMVCRLLDVPIALFNLIDDQRQFYKSVQGLDATNAPLDGAFCPHAFHEPDMLLVPNAHLDERFADNPFVTGKYLNVGFYAGCVVCTPDGMPVGTLCAIDLKPRDMTEEQLTALRDLTAMVETELKVVMLANAQKNLEEELSEATRLAMVDPLTRLWNRAGIDNLLNKEWYEARRHKKPVCLVLADIDHFKSINDTYGHQAGDEVLRVVAKKLLESMRDEDVVGRMGGEEFLLILNDCEPEKLFETIDRIRSFITENPVRVNGTDCSVTLSFGAATIVPDMATPPAFLIKRADDALYLAKKDGRNCVKIAA